MLGRIVRWCIANAWAVAAAAAVLLVYGIVTIERARFDVFPEFVPAQATVQTEAPGMVAEQVEALVTRPIENAVNGANGVATVRSESTEGLSVIDVTFREGADPYRARQIVAEAVAEGARQLPSNVKAPVVTPLTSSTMDLLKIGFTSTRLSPQDLRALIEWRVRPRILATSGVARANLFGGDEPRYEVQLRPESLIARGLALADVATGIAALTTVRGGGFNDTPEQRILIAPGLGHLDAKALADAPIAVAGGPAVRLGDIANVEKVPGPAIGDALVMGRPGVLLTLSSQYGANTLEATHAVEATLAELRPMLAAEGVQVEAQLHRPANFIEIALQGITIDLVIGAVLIGAVLLLFLRNLRVAAIAFTSIPLSLLAALIVLDRLGMTINTMTLGGLAVALGVVVDDAIVDVENIVRRLRLSGDAPRLDTIAAASIEVRAPVVYATWVLALTIAPVLFLSGLQGAFFAPLAFAFLLAVLASLSIAVTVTPALAALLLKRGMPHPEPRFLTRAKNGHRRLLIRFCAMPDSIVTATAAVSLVTVAAFFLFGAQLLPSFRERHYVLGANGPIGASLAYMRSLGTRISRDLLAIPEVATVEQQIGRAEAGEDTFPPSQSEFHVELKPVNGAGEDAALAKIRKVLASYPGIQTEAVTFLGDRIGESLSGETAAVAVELFGPDLRQLDRAATQVASAITKVPGAADVQVKSPAGTPTLRISLDPQRMTARGVDAAAAYDAIALATQGHVVAQVLEADRTTDIALVLPAEERRDPEEIGKILVNGPGQSVRLGEIAEIALAEGRSSIRHLGGQRVQTVTANPTRADIAGFVADVRSRIGPLPDGVSMSIVGAAEGQQVAARQLGFNVAVATIAMIGLLILAFGGVRAAGLILVGTPFAFLGGVGAVAVSGGVLSLGALVGFVTLFGIAARNAILLVSHTDHLIENEGARFSLSTVLRAAEERVTPILMTALVTALALVPLALETGQAGREVQGPMALVILGGLVTSTAMSLLLLPPLVLRYRRGRDEETNAHSAA